MGTTRLGWCLTGHHTQCWEWTESGSHCGCPCHEEQEDGNDGDPGLAGSARTGD